MTFALSPERERQMIEILGRYPTSRAACVPLLHVCQAQQGHITPEVIAFVASKLAMTTAQVEGLVTFHTQFHTQPVPAKHQVSVCKTLSCALRGAGEVLGCCEKKLGIKVGETTPDGTVALRTVECIAACGRAPAMLVDQTYHENLTPDDVDRILDRVLADG
jgi:NADH-quinone oxidoreductase subunit E